MINLVTLEKKRILVTGASSGIGRACAVLLSKLGASVILVARRNGALNDTLALMGRRESHKLIIADLSDLESIKPMMIDAVATGPLDGIVHAAGLAPICPIGILSDELIRKAFQVNVFSFLKMVSLFSKKKYGSIGGSLVAISSIAAHAGWISGTLYCSSKGALSSSIPALALELAPKKIRVNAVLPSYVKTPMFGEMQSMFPEQTSENDPLQLQPLGVGQPDQIASVVAFLLSDASSFITGVNLPVDGGYLAR